MTKDETRAMLFMIRANYPQAFRDAGESEMRLIAQTWHDVFEPYDSSVVRYALTECFKTSRFAPSIAEVLGKIKAIMYDFTDEDDWKIACKMIRNGNWLTKEEWDEAPEHIRRWFGSMSAVKELANQEGGTLQTVTRGQFMKTIGAVREDCKIRENMPAELKQAIQEALNENNDKGDTPVIEQIPGTV